jgi:NADP-dependent 3-hydroxy acid dehydrogenase YdfG
MIVADGALAGKTAVVTGASSGIGLAAANRLHDLGATVTALARRREAMAEGIGDRAIDLRALDVTDREATAAALDHERIDALILAAGTNVKDRALADLSPESWDATVRTNLDGVYHCVRAALPALRAAEGIVVIVGSVSGSWPDISGPAYQATKAGVLALARGAALEEFDAKTGVRFSVIAPGVVDTPILENRPNIPPPEQRPLMLTAEDVAEMCAYLAALPPRVHVPELTMLPTRLQALGRTS